MKFTLHSTRPHAALRHALTWCLSVAAVAGCSGSSAEVELLPEAREGMFYTSLADAQHEAQSQHKHILLDMWRPSCQWCDSMDANTWPDSSVQALSDRIVFVKIDGWEDTLTSSHWGVSGYPTLILLTADLEEVDRIPGYEPASEFLTSINDFIAGRGTLADLTSRWSQHPDSLPLLAQIGGKYQYRGKDVQAESCYTQLLSLDPGNQQGQSADALHSMGMIAYVAGKLRYDTAIARFEVLIAKYPTTEAAEDAETWVPYIMAKQERFDEALARFDKFKLDHPQSTEIDWVNRQMADILKKKGAPAEGTL